MKLSPVSLVLTARHIPTMALPAITRKPERPMNQHEFVLMILMTVDADDTLDYLFKIGVTSAAFESQDFGAECADASKHPQETISQSMLMDE